MAYVIEQGYNYKYQPLPASPAKFQVLVLRNPIKCQDYLEDDEIVEPNFADDTDEGSYDVNGEYTGIEAQNDPLFWSEADELPVIGRLDLDDVYEADDDDITDSYFHTIK